MKALIIGDSQTWGIGTELSKLLKAAGWAVKLERHSGWSTKKLYNLAKTLPARGSYQKVYIQTGGNDYTADPSTLVAMVNLFPAGTVTVISLPPATQITSIATAKKVFGSHIKTADHWFKGSFAKKREQKNAAYKSAVAGIAQYIDVRQLGIPGVKQPTGVIFPNQADGVHVKGEAARQIAQRIMAHKDSDGAPWVWVAAVAAGVVGAYLIARKP